MLKVLTGFLAMAVLVFLGGLVTYVQAQDCPSVNHGCSGNTGVVRAGAGTIECCDFTHPHHTWECPEVWNRYPSASLCHGGSGTCKEEDLLFLELEGECGDTFNECVVGAPTGNGGQDKECKCKFIT